MGNGLYSKFWILDLKCVCGCGGRNHSHRAKRCKTRDCPCLSFRLAAGQEELMKNKKRGPKPK